MYYTGNRLVPADEQLVHQTVDTFATVSQSDLSWTEKVWASLFPPDGSVQIDVGIGKYPNRNVFDGFGGVSRGKQQWTVRASRELASRLTETSVGPIGYDVRQPLEQVRFRLEENDVVPIAFDVTLTGLTPPVFEDRDRRWDNAGLRVVTDVLRYHQPVGASGWVAVDGRRQEFDDWIGFRDHSWGVRRNVGQDAPDLRKPSRALADTTYLMHWAPFALQRPDGSRYELHYHLQQTHRTTLYSSGYLYTPGRSGDVDQVRAWRVTPELAFDPVTRRLLGGQVVFDLESGERRVLEVDPMSDTGFHLGTALYLDFRGEHHGSWRGASHSDGEYLADCTDPALLPELHQLRDCIVHVRDGDATGWGLVESIMTGSWPQWGLEAEGSFV